MRPEDTTTTNDGGRAPAAGIGEVIELIRRYVIQETIGPLRTIGKRLLFGAVGGLLIGTGLVLLLLGVLRVLQSETGTILRGNGSFWPYLCTFVVGLGVVGVVALLLFRAIGNGGRRRPR